MIILVLDQLKQVYRVIQIVDFPPFRKHQARQI